MGHKKKHPNSELLGVQGGLVCTAIKHLVRLGIQIMSIDCTHAMPIIQVFDCPGVNSLRQERLGQGQNLCGRYIRKMAQVKGCQIEWNEVIG